eukprot:1970327-Pleurochrysis_carterae.AAC.1
MTDEEIMEMISAADLDEDGMISEEECAHGRELACARVVRLRVSVCVRACACDRVRASLCGRA